jgi:hypothetical protein
MVKNESKPEYGHHKWIVILLLLLLAVTVSITVWALFFRDTTTTLAPDYAPQQVEENAETIEDESEGEKLEQQEGGGAVSLTYSREVEIDLSEKKAKLLFANPGKSNQDMMVQIIIQDTAILQSGLLSPGYQVTTLDLFDKVELSSGTYEGKFVVYYYQRDTGEKAMLNTEIPLTITVKE